MFYREIEFSSRAGRLIKADFHVDFVCKGSSSKPPASTFRWSSIYYTELQFTDKLHKKIVSKSK